MTRPNKPLPQLENEKFDSDGNVKVSQQLGITTLIDDTAFDLNAAVYDETVNNAGNGDYIIDSLTLDFTTAESRTITLTSDNGTKIYSATNTNLSVAVGSINFGQEDTQNVRVQITQTAGACSVDVMLNIKNSAVALTADPVIAAGTNYIGQVGNEGHICEDNSSTDNIVGSGTFTGAWQDTLNYNSIIIGIKSDKDSATDGLVIQWSSDGVTIHDDDVFTISANKGKVFTFCPARRYLRLFYTNGADTTTLFNLQTVFKTGGIKASSHRIQDSIVAEDDAELVKAVLTGVDEDGTFQNVSTTQDGDLTISDNSSGLAIAQSKVTGISFIHKFGAASDFDTGDGFVTVWDGAEDGEGYEKMVYTYSTSADIDTLSSDDAGNTQDIEVQGLDANYDLIIQTKTLAGLAKVTLDTPLIRVFRLKNVDTTDISGHAFISVDGTLTAGVPTPTNVRAIIHGENNQTEMAVFTIPAGKTGYMRDWYASTAGAKRDSSHTIRVIARPFGQVFQLKHTANIDVNGTSYIKHNYTEPEKFIEKTDIEIRMNTDQDIAGVAAGFDIVLVDN